MKKTFMSFFVPFSVLTTLSVMIMVIWVIAEDIIYGETHYSVLDSIIDIALACSLYKNLKIKFSFGEGWDK